MAAAIGKFAANKMLSKHMKKYSDKKVEGGDDPFFAMVEDPKRPGKMKKVKKQIPAYIPEHDAMVLASVRKTAYRLDMCLFNFLGIRFGWEAVIGIIPVAGDVIGLFMALILWRKCQKVEGGLDSNTNLQMLFNIALDFAVGLIPFVGDLADAAFKANTKNARLLERQLDKKYRPQGAKDERDLAGVDRAKRRQNRKSGIYHPRDPPPATEFDDLDSEAEERRQFIREQDAADAVRRPEETRAPQQGRGWFSGGRGDRQDPVRGTPSRQASRRQESGSVRR